MNSSLFSQDLKLFYNQPATKWTEALPLGNGRIGAMVFGGIAKDRIQFNEETLWTGEPRNYNKKGAYKYLDTIRQLLFDGKQNAAEALAEKEFMGTKSYEGERADWIKNVLSNREYAAENYNDANWKTMEVPSFDGWESVGYEGLDGAIWLRTYFTLPTDWSGKDLTLDLNRIRDYDVTFVNGKLVGTQQNNDPRKYTIPSGFLHGGKNSIAIQVINYFDKGGICGYKDTTKHIGLYPNADVASKLSLNGNWNYFIQNDNPPAVSEYQASYQPFGDLFLNFNYTDSATNYRRELNLKNAISTTSFNINNIKYQREYFVSQPNQALVVHLSASQKGAINFEAVLSSPHKNNIIKKMDNNKVSLHVQVRGGALHGDGILQIITTNGTLNFKDNTLIIQQADEATICLALNTNYKNYKDVSQNAVEKCNHNLQTLNDKNYEQIKAAHKKEYEKYFNTFSIELNGKTNLSNRNTLDRLENFTKNADPSFAALYLQYGRYLAIAASRPGTRPANLQGIWNDMLNPPWGSKYTTNINAEMNYWGAELLNLSPTHQPLFDMIEELSNAGKETAKEYYQAPGWVVHHNTDLWRGTAPINASNHGIWVTGGAWLCQHLWEHYLFTQDKIFLQKKAFPIMLEAAQFFNNYLVKDPKTGWLISSPSNSPEQGGLVAGPTMDHQIIRQLFKNVVDASTILNTQKTFAETLKNKIKNIAPNKIGRLGQLQEWQQDVDDSTNKHRHISHLWALYPGSEINYDETPKLVQAAKQSLLFRGDAATGWSLGWKINCWARFKDGEHAFKMIQMLLSPVKNSAGSYPNLFDAHPPFQIDGNFGGAAGIAEMLLQSHTKFIDVLPALPSALPNGKIKGICARGGFQLDFEWNDNALQKVKILSKSGKQLQLRYKGKTISIPTIKNKVYSFNGNLQAI